MACVKRRRNRWVVDFRDQDGKRRWESYRTRDEANDALSARLGDVKHGTYVAPADLPNFEDVASHWLEGKRADHPASTFAYWENHVRGHLSPAFDRVRLDRLGVDGIERFRNALREKLAPTTVNQVLQTLGAILDDAARRGLIQRNPARLVKRARRKRTTSGPSEAVDPKSVLTAEQAGRLIEAAEPGFCKAFVTTAVLTGMRSGELLALTWENIDFEGATIRVGRSLSWAKARDQREGGPRAYFGPPKSESSRRVLPMAPELARALKGWRLKCPKGSLDLVFGNLSGEPLHRSWVTKGIRQALDRCPDLPRVTTHELRHSFASLLLAAGRPVTQVAKLLGHKDAKITLGVYAHWFEGVSSDDAVNELAGEVFRDRGSKMVAVEAPEAVST